MLSFPWKGLDRLCQQRRRVRLARATARSPVAIVRLAYVRLHIVRGATTSLARVDGSRAMVSSARQLIVLGSDVTALAVVRDASHLGMSPVVVDTQRGIATTSRLARMEVHTDAQPTELIPLVRTLAGGSSSALLATSDLWLRTLVEQRAEFASTGAHILHPRNASLKVCLDKRHFAAWCKAHALPTPRVYDVRADAEACRDIAFPVLVRPTSTVHDKVLRGAPKSSTAASTDSVAPVSCPSSRSRCSGASCSSSPSGSRARAAARPRPSSRKSCAPRPTYAESGRSWKHRTSRRSK